jgi:predicted RNase H-like HicB family nuclease
MKPYVVLTTDDSGWITARVLDMPNCVNQGRTEAEAFTFRKP